MLPRPRATSARPRRAGRALALVGLAGAVTLLLAGCGSDEGSAPSAPVTVTQTVTSTPAPTETATSPTITASTAPPTLVPDTSDAPTTSSGSGVPSDYEDAAGRVINATSTIQSPLFQTSNDTYCVLRSKYLPAACELGRGEIKDVSYCGNGPAGNSVGRIEFHGGRPQAICNSDTIRGQAATTASDGVEISDPGSDVLCLVQDPGVICVDTQSHTGFYLAPGEYQLYD